MSFGLIGVASTLAYAVLYLVLRAALPAQAANCALAAADRGRQHGGEPAPDLRRARRRRPPARTNRQGLVVFALGLAVTSGSLFLLRRYDPAASHAVELAVLIAASVIATLLRFVLFRAWIFPQRRAHAATTGGLR